MGQSPYICQKTSRHDTLNTLSEITHNKSLCAKFIKIFSNELNSMKAGRNPTDPERAMRHQDWMKMLKDMGYSPSQWDKLSTDEQIEKMDAYYDTHGGEEAAKKMGYIPDVED